MARRSKGFSGRLLSGKTCKTEHSQGILFDMGKTESLSKLHYHSNILK